jgi:hypothetical protein
MKKEKPKQMRNTKNTEKKKKKKKYTKEEKLQYCCETLGYKVIFFMLWPSSIRISGRPCSIPVRDR